MMYTFKQRVNDYVMCRPSVDNNGCVRYYLFMYMLYIVDFMTVLNVLELVRPCLLYTSPSPRD